MNHIPDTTLRHDPEETSLQVLDVRGLAKSYGHVTALRRVDLTVDAGEVLAIVGDNGAGKSTFVKIVAGVEQADQGEIFLDGTKVDFSSPRDARNGGIEVVYQDLGLAPDLSIWANIFLGREIYSRGPGKLLLWMNKRVMRTRAREELGRLKIPITSVDARVEDLSGGQRQAVAVARSVLWGRRLVLMDEPTASLGVEEGEKVGKLVNALAADGLGVILVSHNLHEVFRLASRVVVFRQGQSIANQYVANTTREEVVGWITGALEGSTTGQA